MNKMLEVLYDKYVENSGTSKELSNAYDYFASVLNNDAANKAFDYLGEGILKETQLAFESGFRTAVQLLTGGNGRQ